MRLHTELMVLISFTAASALYAQDTVRVTKTILSGTIGFSLNKVEYWDIKEQRLATGIKSYLPLNVGVNIGRNYMLITTFYYYVNRNAYNITWLPDYSLMIRRDKYIPKTFYWGYNNFGDNKFSNSWHRALDVFSSGTFYCGYRFKLPGKFFDKIKVDSSANLQFTVELDYSAKYFDRSGEFNGGIFKGKPIATVGLQYTFLRKIYLMFSVYNYLRKSTKMPFDSEYSYGFGINNSDPWTFVFSYSNGMNRFPWNDEKIKSGFFYGNFMVGFNYTWNHKVKQ